VKILVADDHHMFREGLIHALQQLEESPTIIEACDFPQAIEAVQRETDLELILLDLSMPGLSWEEGIGEIRAHLPEGARIVILSASDDQRHIRQAVALGAAGFVSKASSSRVMLSALRLVLSGGVYLPPAMLTASPVSDNHGSGRGDDGSTNLTPRQREVLALLSQGKSNKEIARVLNLAEGTVKLHVTAIMKSLNVNNRTRAVVAASQLGLTEPV